MAAKKNYAVNVERGLNLREAPDTGARVIAVLGFGEKVVIDPEAEAPDGWVAVRDGGYVMREYLK